MSQPFLDDHLKNRMVEKMGYDFGILFQSLYYEVIWLTFKWMEYENLYGKKESRVEILNSSAPFMFYIIQNSLWENIILGICRITDPPETRGKKNITLTAMSIQIKDNELKKEIEFELNELNKKVEFCRDWRNRMVAHLDYDLAINTQFAKPLEIATRLKIKEAIHHIHKIIKKIFIKFLDSDLSFDYIFNPGGAESLLLKLENGLRFENEKKLKMLTEGLYKDNFPSKV